MRMRRTQLLSHALSVSTRRLRSSRAAIRVPNESSALGGDAIVGAPFIRCHAGLLRPVGNPSGAIIYSNSPGKSEPALRIVVDDAGKVTFVDVSPAAATARRVVGDGVFSSRERRMITPADGRAFLDEVALMLANSSTWTTALDLSGE